MTKNVDRPVWRRLAFLLKWLCIALTVMGVITGAISSSRTMMEGPTMMFAIVCAVQAALLLLYGVCERRARKSRYWGIDILLMLPLLLAVVGLALREVDWGLAVQLLTPYMICCLLPGFFYVTFPWPLTLVLTLALGAAYGYRRYHDAKSL